MENKLLKHKVKTLEEKLSEKDEEKKNISLSQKEQLQMGIEIESINDIAISRGKFLVYLVSVVDDRYINYLYFVKDEDRIYFSIDLIKYKIKQLIGNWVEKAKILDLIKSLNTFFRFETGHTLLLEDFKEMAFKVTKDGKEEKIKGLFSFVNLKGSVGEIIKAYAVQGSHIAVTTFIEDNIKSLNSEYLKNLD